MSAIQFLREKAGALVAVVIGVSLLLFIIGDLAGSGSGQNRRYKKYYQLGEINGEKVSYQDFETKVQSAIEIYNLTGVNITEDMYSSIRESIWSEMIREKILDKNYDKIGIGISTEELDEMVLGNNPHSIVQQLFTDQSGTFNKSALVNFLKQVEYDETVRNYWLYFEDQIVADRAYSKFINLISKGLSATTKQAEYQQQLNIPTVDFSYILKPYTDIADTAVMITQQEVNGYYSQHKEEFKQEERRDIEYVTFDIVPSESDYAEAENWIKSNVENFATATDIPQFINLNSDATYSANYQPLDRVDPLLQEFVEAGDKDAVYGPYQDGDIFKIARIIDIAQRPDSVHARHILLQSGTSYEEIASRADSLADVVRRGRESFATLAELYSEDSGSAQLGGDLGWFNEGDMVADFNEACFANQKGDVVVVESEYGFHIIQILDQSRRVRKYNVGTVERNVIAGSSTIQNIYSEASAFAGKYDTPTKFDEGIAELGLEKQSATGVSHSTTSLPNLDSPRQLVLSLFSAKENSIILDDNQQAIFEIGDKYVVAFCKEIQEEGYTPINDVQSSIIFSMLDDKKADMISAEYEQYKGQSLSAIASNMKLSVENVVEANNSSYNTINANEPALIAAATALGKEGVVAGPVKGNRGVYMFCVDKIAQNDPQDIEILKSSLNYTYTLRANSEAYQAMYDQANIVDQRYKFY